MIGLETDRLVFRQWQKSDVKAFSGFFASEENARFVGGVQNEEQSWRLMASYVGHYVLNGYSYLAVTEKGSEALIGSIGLWNSDPWPEPEIGYWLLPEFQGKGYGAEAGIALKDYALNQLKFDTLVSYIDSRNEASKKLALRLGGKYDGTVELLSFGLHEVYRYK